MGEWPKKLPELQATAGGWEVEVIPAEIGQELYEALKMCLDLNNPVRDAALARYEKEVSP